MPCMRFISRRATSALSAVFCSVNLRYMPCWSANQSTAALCSDRDGPTKAGRMGILVFVTTQSDVCLEAGFFAIGVRAMMECATDRGGDDNVVGAGEGLRSRRLDMLG